MTGPSNYGLPPEPRRKRWQHKKHSTKFSREYGIGLMEIAERLGVSYSAAWNLMQDPIKRKAIVKDLGLKGKKQ